MEPIQDISDNSNTTKEHNDKNEEVKKEVEQKPGSSQGSAVPKKMKVAEYLQNTMYESVTSVISRRGEIQIGNTIFLINGRLLSSKEGLLAGKIKGTGNICRFPYVWCNESHKKQMALPKPRYKFGVLGTAKEVETELAAFDVYITKNILKNILAYTNAEMRISEYYTLSRPSYGYPLTLKELKAFIGILFLSSIQKHNKTLSSPLRGICGNDIHSTIMTKERFDFLVEKIRFDDYSTRRLRKSNDSFAEIREVWEEFIKQCSDVYRPTATCTIDEMFVDCIGKCNFKWPLPNEPGKSGIKLILLCDTNNRYVISGIPYLDRNNNGAIPLTEYLVEKLAAYICGTNTTITYGNGWFNSIPLSNKLLNYYKIKTVGVLHSSVSEIPPDMMVEENRPEGTSIFAYNVDDNLQICSYYPQKKEINVYLSNVHFDTVIEGPEGKPQVSGYYESTKNGVNAIIKLICGSSCMQDTVHWFIAIFFTILDFAGINSLTIFNMNRSRHGKPPIRRVDFIYKLALDLMLPFMKERLMDPKVNDSMKSKIKIIIEECAKLNINDVSKYTGQQTRVQIEGNTPDIDGSISSTLASNSDVWDSIRDMYPTAPFNKLLCPDLPCLHTKQQPNFAENVSRATCPPPQPITPIQSASPCFNLGISTSNIYMNQNPNVYRPSLSITSFQWILPFQNTAWYLPDSTSHQIQMRYLSNTLIRPTQPVVSMPNIHENMAIQIQHNNSANQPAVPIQNFTSVLHMQHYPADPKLQQMNGQGLTNLPNQSPTVTLQNPRSHPTNLQSSNQDSPTLSDRTLTHTKSESSECGVCNYISKQKYFDECITCSTSLCEIHRIIMCTNCYQKGEEAMAIPDDAYTITKGKCGLCKPEGGKTYPMRCSNCFKFVCLKHRRTECIFCLEE